MTSLSDAFSGTRRMMGRLLGLCSLAALLLVVACAPEPAATDPIARGRQVYRELGCANCHEASFSNFFRPVGPPLDHAGQVAVGFREVLRPEHVGGAPLAAEVAVDAKNNVAQMFNKV